MEHYLRYSSFSSVSVVFIADDPSKRASDAKPVIVFGRQFLSQNLCLFLRVVGSASYVQQSCGKVFVADVYDMTLPFLNRF